MTKHGTPEPVAHSRLLTLHAAAALLLDATVSTAKMKLIEAREEYAGALRKLDRYQNRLDTLEVTAARRGRPCDPEKADGVIATERHPRTGKPRICGRLRLADFIAGKDGRRPRKLEPVGATPEEMARMEATLYGKPTNETKGEQAR